MICSNYDDAIVDSFYNSSDLGFVWTVSDVPTGKEEMIEHQNLDLKPFPVDK